jgi:tetratricopeptide (TPR) repeat protein
MHTWRGDVREALPIAEELSAVANQIGGRVERMLADAGVAQALWHNGQNHNAARRVEHLVEAYDPKIDVGQVATLPLFMHRGYAAHAVTTLGYPDQGLAEIEAMLGLARTMEDRLFLGQTLFHGCFVRVWRGEAEELIPWAQEAVEIPYPGLVVPTDACRGWAMARLGQPEEGLSRIRAAIDAIREYRIIGWARLLQLFAAEIELVLGHDDEALDGAAASLSEMRLTDDLQFVSPALVIIGDCHLASSATAEAEADYREALDVARAQEGRLWELRAATRLARLWHSQGKTTAARNLLAPIYGWFTEGFDTADLKDAQALLNQLN